MKLLKIEETNSHGKPIRYVFSCGSDEANLMMDLLKKANRFIPECESSAMLKTRIHEMLKNFRFALRARQRQGTNFEERNEQNSGPT